MPPIEKLIDSSKTSFLYLLIVIGLITICDFIFFVSTEQYSSAILGALACLSLHLLPVYFFRNKIKLYLFFLTPIFIFLPLNLASIILFDVPINDATIVLALNTNPAESFELLKGYIPSLLISFLLYVGVLYLLVRKIPATISANNAKIIGIASISVFMLLPLVSFDGGSYFMKLRTRYYSIFPTSLLYAGNAVFKQNRLINSSKEQRAKYLFHAKAETTIVDKQVHLLIIGESSRYDHWGLNGYSRNTSPKLSKRENFISFSNAAAGGFITEFAAPLMITGVGADNFDKHFQQKSIVSLFKEAGFNTYWISNQVDQGHIKVHIDEADNKFLNLSDSKATKNVHRDMELVGALKKVLGESGTKKFIVIHTAGSHYDYSVRYPDEFDFFKPSNKTIHSKSADKAFKDVLINSYDNTIRYSDAVIDSIIGLVSSQNALASVTYMSDHGENLFDDSRDLSQHAYPVPSKYIAHTPFFVWYSPILKNRFPTKIDNLQKHVNSKVSSENIIHTLSSMSGLTYPLQDSLKNITSPYFVDNEQKILGADKKVYLVETLK
ncbi:phosphoethanolamine transferase [Arcicella lustrica]|uniref:Phosphoethanolamine transferase n=1 Tax=Arcicella lustrica TaxID=2984196 RepID=A0ABU5SR47_9BACT|nr:phosphoethanolamine transferase [Arcicella sp. DC25W]MEA5429689.1 phosphoethanolamine transferase [Arcicella sp. DC25W]